MRSYRRSILWVLLLAGGLLSPVGQTAEPNRPRPTDWATKLDRPGLPNLHKVNGGLYRGAQPTAQGVKELEKLGVKTIVCLRSRHSDEKLVGNAAIALVDIPLNTWAVHQADVVQFLRAATDEDRQPVFVHCQHGADRTGVMCAAYRVVIDGWTKQQAIDEMTKGGFGFHSVWSNLPELVERLDVDKIRAELWEEGTEGKEKGEIGGPQRHEDTKRAMGK